MGLGNVPRGGLEGCRQLLPCALPRRLEYRCQVLRRSLQLAPKLLRALPSK